MRELMSADDVRRTLDRIAHEIVERDSGAADLALVGIWTRGVPLARRLAKRIGALLDREIPQGELDITLHRDDLSQRKDQPVVRKTVMPFDVTGMSLVLVDDVLFSGRTIRAALDELTDWGRAARIRLAVLVDRGHRELPIHADFVGRTITTAFRDRIRVHLAETDGEDRVWLAETETR